MVLFRVVSDFAKPSIDDGFSRQFLLIPETFLARFGKWLTGT